MNNLIRGALYTGLCWTVVIVPMVYVPLFTIGVLSVYTLLSVLIFMPFMRNSLRKKKGGSSGYIYYFTDIGQLLPVVKIGRTNNLKRRLREHNTGAPFGMFVYCSFLVYDDSHAERYIHTRYDHLRIRPNGEWYWLTPNVLIEILLLKLLPPRT